MATAKKKTVTKKPAKIAKPKPEVTQAITEPKSSKKAQILALLERPEGATINEMMALTNWQSNTARGFLSMLKKAGKNVTSERVDNVRRYFINNLNY